ncbi:FMN reductase/FAD reductase [NAD(P)H] [Scopulibacillus darangshiensis]|uniref:FMN reductase/FAD reductase [NAD(P)H] n=1 Tax=Scopulibacillus darangshiensis TaxID=442528 RepID=A0A4R2NEJ3_9BACL|nr:NAD(P)H-dependent oxidoreductase [Scopulibacillus darangshiensis]TCP19532.1 FMN reductase/FAD reductase [NAD(P)H] [Scopulibacillus darangshiensis]
MKVLGISGTVVGSKTPVIVQSVLDEIKSNDQSVNIDLLNLKDYDVKFCDGRDPMTYTGDTKIVIQKITEADCYIIGTPVFQGSIPGALKNLFDLLPLSALRHKVVGYIATGGSYQHYSAVENQLRPILSYFRAYVAPGYTYVHSNHFNEKNEINSPEITGRISSLAKEILFLQKAIERGG